MHYGPIIKKIRCEKRLTQKEIYSGIVSRSFCAKLERGEYSIEITKFHLILEHLTLTFEEFLLFCKPSSTLELNGLLSVYYQLDLHTLEKLMTVYEQNKLSDLNHERFLASTAYALACSLKPFLDRAPLEYFKAYFIQSDFFTLTDLELVTITLFLFLEDEDAVTEELLTKVRQSIHHLWGIFPAKIKELIGFLYINMIQCLLVKKDIHSARHLHLSFQKWFTEAQLSLTTRLYFDFFTAFLSNETQQLNEVITFLKKYDPKTCHTLLKIKESATIHFGIS